MADRAFVKVSNEQSMELSLWLKDANLSGLYTPERVADAARNTLGFEVSPRTIEKALKIVHRELELPPGRRLVERAPRVNGNGRAEQGLEATELNDVMRRIMQVEGAVGGLKSALKSDREVQDADNKAIVTLVHVVMRLHSKLGEQIPSELDELRQQMTT